MQGLATKPMYSGDFSIEEEESEYKTFLLIHINNVFIRWFDIYFVWLIDENTCLREKKNFQISIS